MNSYSIYDDIAKRTNGEIYMAVVGPVRTGKSTFIRRFMEMFVLPKVEENQTAEITDQLPVSGSGTTITTVEPKFIPKEAIELSVSEEDPTKTMKLKLIDCVGYMVEGANGHIVDGSVRMVKTPWSDEEIPFTEAADIGTKKVIFDHSSVAVVVTTDGSISDIPRENYVSPEEQTVKELKSLGKPFIIVLNCTKPYSTETKKLSDELENKYKVPVIPINLEQLKEDDILKIFEKLISMFPVSEVIFEVPEYVYLLDENSPERQELFDKIRQICEKFSYMKDVNGSIAQMAEGITEEISLVKASLKDGRVNVRIKLNDSCFYNFISELLGFEVSDEAEYYESIKKLSVQAAELMRLKSAWEQSYSSGYGVVLPQKEEVVLQEPEIIKQGNKFGVKIHANAPCTHFIRTEIDTELAPIVGSQSQAEDLFEFIKSGGSSEGLWNTNIFGKSMGQMVEEGIASKISSLSDESRQKLQESMNKIVNESCGLVCFII